MTIIAECRSTFAVRLNMREKKSRVGRKTSKNQRRATETLIHQNRRYMAETLKHYPIKQSCGVYFFLKYHFHC